MLKTVLTALAALLLILPAEAGAGRKPGTKLVAYSSPLLPPTGYRGQWWTSPDKCQYSRAGRAGETVWYLIVNTAHGKCQKRLIQRAYSDYE